MSDYNKFLEINNNMTRWLYKVLKSVEAKKKAYIENNGYFNIDDCYKDCVAPTICKELVIKYNL